MGQGDAVNEPVLDTLFSIALCAAVLLLLTFVIRLADELEWTEDEQRTAIMFEIIGEFGEFSGPLSNDERWQWVFREERSHRYGDVVDFNPTRLLVASRTRFVDFSYRRSERAPMRPNPRAR